MENFFKSVSYVIIALTLVCVGCMITDCTAVGVMALVADIYALICLVLVCLFDYDMERRMANGKRRK